MRIGAKTDKGRRNSYSCAPIASHTDTIIQKPKNRLIKSKLERFGTRFRGACQTWAVALEQKGIYERRYAPLEKQKQNWWHRPALARVLQFAA